jgi:hypothetical protein
MLRTEIINRLIQKNNYKSYLEIGIGSGLNFKNIGVKNEMYIISKRWK